MSEQEPIKQLFVELRLQDEKRAPVFGEVWAAAALRKQHDRRRALFAGVAVAAAVLSAALTVLTMRPPRSARLAGTGLQHELAWQTTLLASDWRSPTDFLLDTPGARPLSVEFIGPRKPQFE